MVSVSVVTHFDLMDAEQEELASLAVIVLNAHTHGVRKPS